MRVSPAAPAALGRDEGLVCRYIRDQPAGLVVIQQGASGNADHAVSPGFAEAAVGPAVLSGLGGVFALIAKVGKGVQAIVGHKHDMAAVPTVPAVWSTRRDVFFPAEAHRAVAAASGFDGNRRFIDKHGSTSLLIHSPAGLFDREGRRR